MFFFEKKNQKTFTRLVPRRLDCDHASGDSTEAKVFCFFFQKRRLPS
jgi:hypothetical protein